MFCIALIFSLIYISQGQTIKRLVNSTDAATAEFPFMVSLRTDMIHFCGGTLVNENYVLTAAHCVCTDTELIPNLSIQYGILKVTNSRDNSIPVTRVVCHEMFQVLGIIHNDVAVLKLEFPVPKESLSTTKLAPPNFPTHKDQHATLVGWGQLSRKGKYPKSLQKVDVTLYNDFVCKSQDIDNDPYICGGAYENGRGHCNADSGGPLLVGGVQVGIISHTLHESCSVSNSTFPHVFARVSAYTNWIIEKTSA